MIYHPTANSSDNESVLINDSNSKAFTIVGLQPRMNYTVTLEAVNIELSLFGPDVQETVITSDPNGTKLSLLFPSSITFFRLQLLEFCFKVNFTVTKVLWHRLTLVKGKKLSFALQTKLIAAE